GVETGGSNVQFAINPKNGRMIVIEMNPRVSRSSALASKATGFPIAKVAAKLAVGYTLDELQNDITKITPASFEPTIDYVVTKIPRFAFEKFRGSDSSLTTQMKSVGEVMAIGRNFQESMQKALRGMEKSLAGFDEQDYLPDTREGLIAAIAKATPQRILAVAEGLRRGLTVAEIHAASAIDPWFLEQMAGIIQAEDKLKKQGLPKTAEDMLSFKRMGFADARIAKLIGKKEKDVRAARQKMNIRPAYRRIDTCAAEFPASTNYFYSSYENPSFGKSACEANPSANRKVVILGGGPNRIGQGIEFDYCCVHAAYALREAGCETIMVNCNPETVSTDYDTSDRLYFEPLTAEDVIEVIQREQQNGELLGVIVQYGGQTPLKLAHDLQDAGIPILGTSVDMIDLAEDRERFQKLIQKLGLKQPANGIARSVAEARKVAAEVGYPIVLRPSYVLGGAGMEIIADEAGLEKYINNAVKVSGSTPLLLDGFLLDAGEVDVDAISDGTDVFIAGIMEHVEEAGVHSGDSSCALPPYSLSEKIQEEIRRQTRLLAKNLGVVGLMNIQFAIKDDQIYLLEVNPRASRTVPFVAKATGVPLAKIGARVMAGEKLATFNLIEAHPKHTAVKAPVFPFNKFPGTDILLSPEMKSTGEVMGVDGEFGLAYVKAVMGAGFMLPMSGTAFISLRERDKALILPTARRLLELGFKIVATDGTASYFNEQGVTAHRINKVFQGQPHIVDAMINGEIQLVINTVEGAQATADSFSLRRTALLHSIPHYTNLSGARAAAEAIAALQRVGAEGLTVGRLQDYVAATPKKPQKAA
ncbi:MAG TPA: carbamoyl phosphate synthase large subunit, partial [Rhodospirillaceae bacterium]|nr:carbamoyl phosphate synthase large subunit [Rhodospirillaceae bacterium]